MNTYIQKDSYTLFVEFEDTLDPNSFELGTTWQDYLDGKWLLLSEVQLAFHSTYPDASIQEVIDVQLIVSPELTPEPVAEYTKEQLLLYCRHTINMDTDKAIVTGFVWNEMQVWLSRENQLNYKTAYDLAVQNNGENGTLPVTFKFGSDTNPIYHTFNTKDELTRFYLSVVAYIQSCCQDGWVKKDSLIDKTDEELSHICGIQ